MPPDVRLARMSRHLVGGLALLLIVALVAVESGLASAGELSATSDAAGDPATEGTDSAGAPAGDGSPGRTAIPVTLGERRVHEVAPGDTPSEIAGRYGVRTSALTRANRHVRPTAMRPGDLLVVPDPAHPRLRTPQDAMDADLPLEALIDEIAREYGWNPALVKAVAWVESRWDHHVVSNREAIGAMQVQGPTGQRVATAIDRPLDLHVLRDNVEAGVAYLDLLHDRYGSDTRALLAAYHQGPTAVRERGILKVSDRYVDNVLRHRDTFAAAAAP